MADNDLKTESKGFCLVAAIDFGTSLSGFAYSDVKTSENTNPQIHHHQCWNKTGKYTDIKKTASCILFDKYKQFHSFGYDAKFIFANLKTDNQRSEYYFFKDFKMALYNHKGSLNTMEMKDVQGKKLLAKEVFTESIKAIKDELLLRLQNTGKGANVDEIRWVLTVPAIWPDNSKLFMKKCAEKAGIPSFQLFIALEPEAASLYCQHLRITKPTALKDGFQVTEIGTKYMVVDIGGGTTDITVHEKTENGCLKELHPVEGNAVGGTTVDLALLHLFEKVISSELLKRLKLQKPGVYLDLYTELEEMKKTIHPDGKEYVYIKIAYSTLTRILKTYIPRTLENTIKYYCAQNKIDAHLDDDNILLDIKEVKRLLENEIRRIIVTLKDVLKSDFSKELNYIILVGGFAENSFLQKRVKEEFPNKTIVTPEEPGLAILKGAVLFGQNPESINPRKTRFTYGVNTGMPFEEGVHSPSRKVVDEWGDEICNECFSLIIQRNKFVQIGTTIRKIYCTSKKFQKSVVFRFYAATTEEPLYVDDDECSYIGKVETSISNPSAEKRPLNVDFVFGNTTISVNIEDVSAGKFIEANIDL